jgi:hypothetical protein
LARCQGFDHSTYTVKDRKEAYDWHRVIEKIEKLTAKVAQLEQRFDDLEYLRNLEKAITENGDKPLIPWEQVKADLELD